jgi:UDP-N-acetylmuramoylalanine--D-glutamate ligase
MTFEALAQQGQTTVYDSLAASIGPKIRAMRKESVRENFFGLQQIEHRLEVVAIIKGMEFINDSKSTTLNSTWFALESVSRPIIWIAGGVEQGNDYGTVRQLVRTKVKAIILLGTDTSKLQDAFKGLEIPMSLAFSMNEAVETAYYSGDHGDAVLLSPACPSFDLFENYEERGNAFRLAVKNL